MPEGADQLLVDRAITRFAARGRCGRSDPRDLFVGEAVPFCPPQDRFGQLRSLGKLDGDLVEERELVGEPRIDPGGLVHLVDGCAGTDRGHDGLQPTVTRPRCRVQQVRLHRSGASQPRPGAMKASITLTYRLRARRARGRIG
jgi:hypothetical protein